MSETTESVIYNNVERRNVRGKEDGTARKHSVTIKGSDPKGHQRSSQSVPHVV
jgi:hypothetical protein